MMRLSAAFTRAPAGLTLAWGAGSEEVTGACAVAGVAAGIEGTGCSAGVLLSSQVSMLFSNVVNYEMT
jgi:hypothetical protein